VPDMCRPVPVLLAGLSGAGLALSVGGLWVCWLISFFFFVGGGVGRMIYEDAITQQSW